MYKDVGKRILAVFMSVCMLLGIADFSALSVRAADPVTSLANVSLILVSNGEQIENPAKGFEYNGKEYDYDIKNENGESVKDQIDVEVKKGTTVIESGKIKNQGTYSYVMTLKSNNKMKRTVTVTIKAIRLQSTDFKLSKTEATVGDINDLPNLELADNSNKDFLKSVKVGEEAEGEEYDYTWEYGNYTTVGEKQGKIIVRPGSTGNCTISNSSMTITFDVLAREMEVAGLQPGLTYWLDDSAQSHSLQDLLKRGDLSIIDSYTGEELNEKDHFTIRSMSSSGIPTRPGQMSYKVEGKGEYKGRELDIVYSIKKEITDEEQLKISGFKEEITYTGVDIIQYITIVDGDYTLRGGTDFISEYVGDRKNVSKNGDVEFVIKFNDDSLPNSYYEGSITKKYRIVPEDLGKVNVILPTVEYDGSNLLDNPELKNQIKVMLNQEPISQDDYELAIVEDDKNGAGSKNLMITPSSNGNFKNSKQVPFNVNRQELLEENIDVEETTFEAGLDSKGGIKTTVVVKDKDKNTVLQEGRDYTLSYSNNNKAGTGKVTITGIGNYSGTVPKEFVIKPLDIDNINFTFTNFDSSPTYTGLPIGQEAMVISYEKQNGEKITLVNNKDYKIEYDGERISASNTVTVKITGLGNYDKTKVISTFEIQPQSIDVSDTATAAKIRVRLDLPKNSDGNYTTTYTTQEIQPAIILEHLQNNSWVKIPKESQNETSGDVVNYNLDWYQNVDKTTGKTEENLAKVTITGNKNYKDNTVLYFEITEMDLAQKINSDHIQIKLTDASTDHNGKEFVPLLNTAVKPAFSLTYLREDGSEYKMEENVNYTIKEKDGYVNNTEPGIGVIQLQGIGNFKGAFTQEFIIKGNLQDMTVTANPKVYTGDEIELVDGDLEAIYTAEVDQKKVTKELHLGSDFRLEYKEDKNNINVGTAKAYVATLEKDGEDVYYYMPETGQKNVVEFQIVPKNIAEEDIIPEYEKDQVYTAQPIYPNMKITYNGHELQLWDETTQQGDYKILKEEETRNNVDVTGKNEAFITIQGTGNNFTGTRRISFTILPRNISDVEGTQFITVPEEVLYPEKNDPEGKRIWTDQGDITIEEPSFTYDGITINGETIHFDSTTDKEEAGTDKMLQGRDYEIIYENNDQVGVATLVIKGTGNFTGTVERNFNIWGDLNSYAEHVQIDVDANKVYNGKKQVLGPDDITVKYFSQTIPFENYVITNNADAIGGDDINATKTHGAEDDVNNRIHISISADDAELEEGKQNLFFGGKTGGDTIEETFAILQRPIDDEEVKIKGIEEDGYTYTGDPIDPRKIIPTGDTKGFRLMFGEKELKEVEETQTTPPAGGDTPEGGDTGEGEETPPEVVLTGDYRVELIANINVPEADADEDHRPHFYIQAREDGNYSGTRKVPFIINPQSINAGDLHIRYRTVDTNGVEKWDELEDNKFSMYYEAKHQGREIRLENELDSFGIFYGDKQLYPGGSVRQDYKITYENNRKPGTATFILDGKGNYKDTKSIKFRIRGKLEDAVIADIPAQPYNQDGVEPEIKVTYFGQELILGEDYNIAGYSNNTEVTRANTKNRPAVKIQGIEDGGFEGEKSKQFSIVPRDLSIAENQVGMSLSGLADYYDYTGSPVEPDVAQLMLCYNGKAVKNGTNEFQFVRYGQNINGGNFEENGTNAPYIEIKGAPYNPDIPGSGNYVGSMRFYFTIKGVSLEDASTFTIEMEGTVPQTVDQYYYTGSDINPTVIVRQEGRPQPLVEGEDYKLEYSGDLKTVGSNDATVIIKGINNYSDTRTAPFMIVGRDMTAFPDEFNVYIPPQIYTGDSIRPQAEDVIVTRLIGDEEVTLEMDTDYILGNCENNTNVGEATIEVIGINNYAGTVKAAFWIQPLDIDINDVMIEGVEDRVYNTLEQIQNVKVTWKGQMLPPTTYELSYSADHTNAGKASVILKLLGNYSGTKSVDFTIASLPLTNSAISVSNIPNQVYSGKPITPALEITYQAPNQRASVKLVQNKDYRLTYTGNQEVGINTAKVTITGIGNYAGELQKTFTIIGSLAQAEVAAIPTQNYTGKAITPSPVVRHGGRTLEAGKDYTLTYANNVEAGKASITITGTGTEFGGSKVVNFDICRDVSAGLQVVGLVNAYLYTGTPVVPPLGKVTAYGKTLMPEKDYKVTVSNNVNAGTASIQIEGIGYYKGSKTFQFNIVKRSVAQATVSKISTVNFNTKAQKPALTVKYGGITLKEGTDYSLKYSNNKFPGKAIVVITGKGNMTGAKVVNFTIKMPSISGAAKAKPSSTTKIKISWKKQDLASGYQIFDNKNKLIKTVKGGTKTSYTVSGLKAGKTYSFKVRYYNETDKRKCYSNFTKTVKTSTKPSTPKITLKSKKSKQATISWKKISGASGYEIYRSTKSKSGFKKIKTTTKTSYTNTKLTSKKRYYYKVRAYRTVNGTKIYSSYSTTKYVKIK